MPPYSCYYLFIVITEMPGDFRQDSDFTVWCFTHAPTAKVDPESVSFSVQVQHLGYSKTLKNKKLSS